MDPEGTYNGWTNYPTWNVKLWIDNDEGLYLMAAEMARRNEGHEYQLANELQTWVTDELAPDLGASFAADLLGWALGSVNWYEIAESLLEDQEAS